MHGRDELFTIEINLDAQHQPSETSSSLEEGSHPVKKIELNVSEILQKLSDLATKKSSGNSVGQHLSEELRKIIFNKNRGAVKSTQAKFYEQAQKLAKLTAEPSLFVPFVGYWPTYEMLTQSQIKWYLFWRSRIIEGEYLETSVSYIFMYLYEIINQVGIEDECDGFIKLCNTWGHYRKSFKELDKYLEHWIADYIEIHFKKQLPEFILNSVNDSGVISLLPFDILYNYIISSKQTSICGQSAVKYFAQLSSYNFENSTFISNLTIKEAEEDLNELFKYTEKHFLKEKGYGLLQSLIPERYFKVTRMAYTNAIYCIEPKKVDVVGFDFKKSKELKIFFTGMFKLVENLFRMRSDKKSLLKTNLDSNIEKQLIFFAEKRHKEKLYKQRTNIKINADEIKKLIKSSNEVRDKLLEGASDDEPIFKDTEALAIKASPTKPKQTNSFADSLSPLQSEIVEYLMQTNGSPEEALNDRFRGCFIQMEIDAINEAAIDFFGDMLLLMENGCYIIQHF